MEPIVIKVADMFGGGGIGTSLFPQLSEKLTKKLSRPVKVEVVAVIECEKNRCEIYKSLHKTASVIHGDVNNTDDLKEFINAAKEAQILCASPVCRSFSAANNSPGKKSHENNRLFLRVNEVIEACNFKAVLIENVPSFLKSRPNNVPELNGLKIGEYEHQFLDLRDFNVTSGVLNAADFSVPQTRRRAFILGIKKEFGSWTFPQKCGKWISIWEAIGDLPALEPIADPINPYIYHTLHRWPEDLINIIRHTEPGATSFLNKLEFQPKTKDGGFKKFYQSSDRRDDPKMTKGTILRKSAGRVACHPGRYMGLDANGNKIFSEARPYSVFEEMIFMGLPRDFKFPDWCIDEEDLLRDILGEGISPPVMNLLLEQIIPALLHDILANQTNEEGS